MTWEIREGDSLELLRQMPDESVQCVVTSPPYWGLRDYGVDGQMGLEETPDEHMDRMVELFREVRRVLRSDGTCWVNYGDAYAMTTTGSSGVGDKHGAYAGVQTMDRGRRVPGGLKPKDLLGLPWMLAFALRADGWWLRSEIIWCLSGGTRVYAKTQKGEMPMSVKDLVRLDPSTVKLWNGEKWTQALGWSQSGREGALEIELRSGEHIGCTSGHVWPTVGKGNVKASDLEIGDVLATCRLPGGDFEPEHIDGSVAWLLGLFLAEGSWDRDRLQFAGHSEQSTSRAHRLRAIADRFGGTVSVYNDGNRGNVVVRSSALAGIVRDYIHGKSAKTKGLRSRVWRHRDAWIESLLIGYLEGDGHFDQENGRWRLGFCRNDRLASDLRTVAARLGWSITLRPTHGTGFGERWPIYRGEMRKARSGHHNERDRAEIVAIRRSRGRQFWDIGVEDEPHLFALASGVLTHNSKPNPMPESVTDRPTKAHEHLFLLTKAARYYYDADALKERSVIGAGAKRNIGPQIKGSPSTRKDGDRVGVVNDGTRNARTVWTINPQPFSGWVETVRLGRVASDDSSGGTMHIVSPDCQGHAGRPDRVPTAFCDAHAAAETNRTLRTHGRPFEVRQGALVPTDQNLGRWTARESSGCWLLESDCSATARSTQSHRRGRDPATSPPCSASAQSPDRTPRSAGLPGSGEPCDRTPASSTSQDERGDPPSARTEIHTASTSSCDCAFYRVRAEKSSHFATFPEALPERCIKAGTSEHGACAACGAPWVRKIQRVVEDTDRQPAPNKGRLGALGERAANMTRDGFVPNRQVVRETVGWEPSCDCSADVVPCTVLDPFAGAGTTLLVAERLGRDSIGCELNPEYARIARERIRAADPMASVEVAPGKVQQSLFGEVSA